MTTTDVPPTQHRFALVEEVKKRLDTELPPPHERRAIRKAAQVSIRRLAHELGITHGSVYYYETRGNPGPDIASRYRDLLNALAAAVGYEAGNSSQK